MILKNKSREITKTLGKRSFHANIVSNRLIAIAAIIAIVLITATCSVFFNLQNFSALQDLKEKGTTSDVILSDPTNHQIKLLQENNQVRTPLYISYKMGRLIGNIGQAGLSIDMYAEENWDTWVKPLFSDFQGSYPTQADEIVMSTWLLKRLNIDPIVGTEIELSVAWADMDAVQSEKFTLSGFYTDTSYIDTASKLKVFVSTELLSQHEIQARLVGFSLTPGDSQRKLDSIESQLNKSEQQILTVLSNRTFNLFDRNNIVALGIILFFMLDGFLIIYNINIISIARDIQFYGSLKTIGMTSKQLKRIMYYRMWCIILLALPIGLLLGIMVTQWIVPLILGNILTGFSHAEFHIMIPVLSSLFSCCMIFMSFYMTARKVRSISPIAASRYTENDGQKKSTRFSFQPKPHWMGLKNAFRHPRKTILVIGTFFLSNIAFLVCMTVLGGMSLDEYIEFNTAHDISLYNHMSRASFSMQEEQSFTPEVIAQLQNLEGVENLNMTKVVPIYEQYSEEIYGEWFKIKSEFEQSMGMSPSDTQKWIENPKAMFWSLLIGIDSNILAAYNQTTDAPIDIDRFENGEFLLTTTMNGNGLQIGDSIAFSIMDTDEQFYLPIGGQIPFERDGMNGGPAPWLIVSNKVIDQYREDAIIYSIKIDSSSEYEESILRDVIELTSNIPAISRTTKIELAESLAEIKRALSGISAFLTIVLLTIGILNFVNTMSMNILSRQKEFATMEAIGATKRQVCTIVTWEGLWYFILTLGLTITVGSAADFMIFNIVKENLGFGSFHYPAVPILLYMMLSMLLCVVIPRTIYKKMAINSIVQRLRDN